MHEKRQTPFIAVLVVLGLSLLFALIGDLALVANITNLFVFFTFALVNLSLLVLRYDSSFSKKKGFRCPGNIGNFSVVSLLGLLSSVLLFFFVIASFF